MDTSICSLNVRGIGNKIKREQVFQWLKEQKFSIYLLQETHLISENADNWESDWGFTSFYSGIKSNSEGICILFDKSFKFDTKNINHIDIVPGRLQVVDIKIEDKAIKIINIYGLNNDDTFLFDKLQSYISENEDSDFIIGGDFNTVLNTDIDKQNGRTDTHKKCRSKINDILNINELSDVWRIQHPNTRKYTWHSNHKPPIFCRLDYFLISNNLINNTKYSNISPGYKTDHSLITLTIDFHKIPRGPGYFKFNNSLLLDSEYKNIVKIAIAESVHINHEANPNILWEVIKGNIRNVTIKFATNKKRKEQENEKKIIAEIDLFQIKIQNPSNIENLDQLNTDIYNKRVQLNELIDNRINGNIIRSKAQLVDNNEKNTKFFSSLEKKRSESKVLRQLNVNGNIINNQSNILLEQHLFYKKLYKKREQSPSFYNFFNDNVNKLNNEDKLLCEGLLTEFECLNALKQMKNNKSPGSDGLTTEFYKIFWTDVKQYLIDSLNYSYRNGDMTDLQKQSIITLLPKGEKDICFLENWRPISLLNVDYKIATKSISNRIKKVITNIISNAQTGFVKGRYIGENIRLLSEIIEYVNELDLPALLFFLILKKPLTALVMTICSKCLNTLILVNRLSPG